MADSRQVSDANTTFGLETQRKLELYFLALTFTVAGLAIQTAKFTENHWQWGLEVAGWVCLAAAGIIGLVRMQRVPPIFAYSQQIERQRHLLSEIRERPPASNVQIEGTVFAQPVAIETIENDIELYRNKVNEINKLVGRLGTFQNSFFVAGLLLVGASRAYAGFVVACELLPG